MNVYSDWPLTNFPKSKNTFLQNKNKVKRKESFDLDFLLSINNLSFLPKDKPELLQHRFRLT